MNHCAGEGERAHGHANARGGARAGMHANQACVHLILASYHHEMVWEAYEV